MTPVTLIFSLTHRFAPASAALAILFTLVSCAPREPNPSGAPAGEEEPGSLPERQEIRIGNSLLKSIQDGDYAGFSRTLAGKTGLDITRQDFEASCGGVSEKYGQLKSWTHLTSLDDPVANQDVWKVRFVKDRNEGKPAERDMLFRLVCAKIGDKISVLAFGFF